MKLASRWLRSQSLSSKRKRPVFSRSGEGITHMGRRPRRLACRRDSLKARPTKAQTSAKNNQASLLRVMSGSSRYDDEDSILKLAAGESRRRARGTRRRPEADRRVIRVNAAIMLRQAIAPKSESRAGRKIVTIALSRKALSSPSQTASRERRQRRA